MENNKSIAALNRLVEINNDRVEGYETAGKEAQTNDLKTLFSGLQSTSQRNLEELSREIVSLGGLPTESTKVTGKFFRAWMDVKAALTGNNKHEIISSCEFGEDNALKVYDEILENKSEDLSAKQLEMIRMQRSKLHADHDKIKALRDDSAAA
jgi:uncharacterized protein (TIGR02284 family)